MKKLLTFSGGPTELCMAHVSNTGGLAQGSRQRRVRLLVVEYCIFVVDVISVHQGMGIWQLH